VARSRSRYGGTRRVMRRVAGAATVVVALLEPAIASAAAATTTSGGASLESAASAASSVGRTIAFSLIGLALAVAGVVLVFKREFKDAVGVLAIGVIAVLLASPIGLTVLQNTVSLLFGGSS
jgi:hypothetical protein